MANDQAWSVSPPKYSATHSPHRGASGNYWQYEVEFKNKTALGGKENSKSAGIESAAKEYVMRFLINTGADANGATAATNDRPTHRSSPASGSGEESRAAGGAEKSKEEEEEDILVTEGKGREAKLVFPLNNKYIQRITEKIGADTLLDGHLSCIYHEITAERKRTGGGEATQLAPSGSIDQNEQAGPQGSPDLAWASEQSFHNIGYNPMVLLQLSSGSNAPSVCLKAPPTLGGAAAEAPGFATFARLCAEEKILPMVKGAAEDEECLYLCGFPKQGCFYGWRAAPVIVGHMVEVLKAQSLCYCFDLDETLLKSYCGNIVNEDPESSFQREWKIIEDQYSSEQKDMIRQFFTHFNERLKEFRKREEVGGLDNLVRKWGNRKKRHTCQIETAVLSNGNTVRRPVVKYDGPGNENVRLTEIQFPPPPVDTNMIFFIRPGWSNRLLPFLKERRQSVWVSTAGEMDYSYEAWRLLDPRGEVIKRNSFKQRINNVDVKNKNEKKSIWKCVLNKSPSRLTSTRDLPFVVTIDDRTDVWLPNEGAYLHNIKAFKPYKNAHQTIPRDNELMRMVSLFKMLEEEVWADVKARDGQAKALWESEAQGIDPAAAWARGEVKPLQHFVSRVNRMRQSLQEMDGLLDIIDRLPSPPTADTCRKYLIKHAEALLRDKDGRTLLDALNQFLTLNT